MVRAKVSCSEDVVGKPWDGAAQMYYFPYRWYSPSAARWLTRDPLGAVDGPNVYVYVVGSLLEYFDALGLSRARTDPDFEKDAMKALTHACVGMSVIEVVLGFATGVTLIGCAAVCLKSFGLFCLACLSAALAESVAIKTMMDCQKKVCKQALDDLKASRQR
ncbi:MAG: RHS repeat-associated core domain-containing protein [Candidatus Hydrogenedentales bacterium]|jgi:RHS repeat-associated protein